MIQAVYVSGSRRSSAELGVLEAGAVREISSDALSSPIWAIHDPGELSRDELEELARALAVYPVGSPRKAELVAVVGDVMKGRLAGVTLENEEQDDAD